MTPRIVLDMSAPPAPIQEVGEMNAPPPASNQLVHIDWESQTDDSLMLYLAEEPQIGAEFSYNGLEWRIVDYRDGWVARLLV